jgi:hypothetical protein
VVALEAVGPSTSGKVQVDEHAGEVYHGTGAEDVEWKAAWPLTKLSPAVHAHVCVLVVAVPPSLVLRLQHLQAHPPGRHGRNSR